MSPLTLLCCVAAYAAEVSGRVRERGTGDPVAGAWLRVQLPDGEREFVAEGDGRFVLDLPEGTWTALVGSELHAAITVDLVVPSARPIDVYVTPAPPEEIVVEARREVPHVSAVVLDRERVEKTPGTYEDPIRLIQALPGVTQTREYSPGAGDIVLRSAAPSESQFYLDGVPVPYLYHFQQYASVTHTRLIDEVAVYPSTFGPAWGDATGGVVAATLREADTAKLHTGLGLSLVMGGAWLTVPVGEQGAVSLSGRRSYQDLIEDGNDQYTLWPVFWDYLGRYDQELGADHHVSVTALGAGDHYARYAGDSALLDAFSASENPSFEMERSFHGLLLRSRDTAVWGRLDTDLGLVQDRWRGDVGEDHQDRRETLASLRHQTLLFETDDYQLALGLEGRFVRADREAVVHRAWIEVKDEAPMLGRGLSVDETLDRWLGGAWLEPRILVGKIRLMPGLRVDGDTASSSRAVSPRLQVQAELAPDLRLRAAAGRYTQAPPLDALSPVTGDPGLGLARSDQVAAGFNAALAGRLELGLDGWAKRFSDVVIEDPGEAPEAVDGTAWGIELTSRYRLRERFFSYVSLCVGHAERGGIPFDYDQPFALSAVASWDFREGWNVGLRYRVAAGLPYTPVESGTYDGDADTWDPVLGEANSARLPTYQKVDGHLERRWAFRNWALAAYTELWWVPAAGNVLYPAWSYDWSEEAYVAGPTFLPLVGMRAEL